MEALRRTPNSRGRPEKGSTSAHVSGGMRRQSVSVRSQPLLHKKHIVQRRDNGEEEGGTQKDGARNPDPAQWPDAIQHHEKHGSNLREGVRLTKNAGLKIAQSRDGKKHRTGRQNRDIAAK